jgi:hypothetical protein
MKAASQRGLVSFCLLINNRENPLTESFVRLKEALVEVMDMAIITTIIILKIM